MNNKDDIISILNAINEINKKPKQKKKINTNLENSIPKLTQNLGIPPDVDKLILEAEKFKRLSTTSSDTILSQNYAIANDKEEPLILKNEVLDSNQIENLKITELNNIVNNLAEEKKKLLEKIKTLKKEKILQLETTISAEEQEVTKSLESSTKEQLNAIYKQVEKQRQLFLDLKKYSIKIERESNIFKENYERLIIENNELKIKLKISKDQITNYENNKTNLLAVLDQLNEILSKNNIVGISPQKSSTEGSNQKQTSKTELID